MKFVIALLLSSTGAVKIRGIDDKEIMQNQPSHFRMAWPEGAIDNGDEDAGVIDMFNEPDVKVVHDAKPESYYYDIDEDV